jgi:hypothetical protein
MLDLTRVRSGLIRERQFSDWGANVIKIDGHWKTLAATNLAARVKEWIYERARKIHPRIVHGSTSDSGQDARPWLRSDCARHGRVDVDHHCQRAVSL